MKATRHTGVLGALMAFLLVGALLGAPPAQAVAGQGYAYMWMNYATAPLQTTFAPRQEYSANSAGGPAANTFVRTGTGAYTVTMRYLGLVGGTVQVTAYGVDSTRCGVGGWAPAGDDLKVYVYCFNPAGQPANSAFDVSFTNPGYSAGALGYVWSYQTGYSAYAWTTLTGAYQFNSLGGANAVLGGYTLRFPGLASQGGHVQVTAYGGSPNRCKVVNWYPSGGDAMVGVTCHDAAGVPTPTLFTATFTDRSGPFGTSRHRAYVFANQPTSASYTPALAYQHNSAGYSNTVQRLGVGDYVIRMPGMPLEHGIVHVTAYGSSPDYCKVYNWYPGDGVYVRCFTTAGSPADTQFNAAFSE